MESRNTYGWGGMHGQGNVGIRSKEELKKWQIAYKTKDGSFGIIGWVCLFSDRKKAEEYGEQFKAEHGYVEKIIIQHPSKYYSNY